MDTKTCTCETDSLKPCYLHYAKCEDCGYLCCRPDDVGPETGHAEDCTWTIHDIIQQRQEDADYVPKF